MEDRTSLVRSYYEHVDEEEYDELIALFADDVVYERPGQSDIRGIEEFERFYLHQRPLEAGSHEVHDVVADGDTVAVRKTFSGVQGDDHVEFDFADFHVFEEGETARRYTFTDRDTV